MIYRLSTGAQSDWKKRLFGGMLIFAVTAGFPVLGAWLNHENLSLNPAQVIQDDTGAVLGQATESPAANPPSTPQTASREMQVTTVPRSRTLAVRHQTTATATDTAPVPTPAAPATPTAPTPTPAVEPPVLPPVTIPEPTNGGDSDIELDVNVLDVVDAEVTVDPGAIIPSPGL